MRVLLAYPPLVNPWSPYLSLPALAAGLRQRGIEDVVLRDLNLEFFEYCTDAGVLGSGAEEARAQLRSPERFPADDRVLLRALTDIEGAMAEASTRFEDTVLHFFTPRGEPDGLRHLLFPYGPCLPRCEMRYNPFSSEEVRAAVDDEVRNPFWGFYRDRVARDLADLDPDVLGISISFPLQHVAAFTLAALVQEVSPRTHVCLGGAQASKMELNLKRSTAFRRLLLPLLDSVVIGEGEATLAALLRSLEGGEDLSRVPGVLFRRGSAVVATGPPKPLPMAELPTPDFDQLPLQRYLNHGSRPSLPLQATRGCYWGKCTFCDSYLLLGRYRARPVGRILDDVVRLHDRYGVGGIQFTDEALPPAIMRRLADHVVERRLPIEWSTYTRFDKTLTPEFCRQVAEGGCRVLFLGLEATSERVSHLMDKGIQVREVEPMLRSLRDSGIEVHLFAMMGFPTETRDEAARTLEFLLEHRDLFVSYSFVPFMLEWNSAVAGDPARYGIQQVAVDEHYDLMTSLPFEPESGLSMTEAAELHEEFNARLAAAGAFNPIFF